MSAQEAKEFRLKVAEEVRRLRRRTGMSQLALADKLGTSGARISRLETAQTVPDLALVMDILDVLGVPVGEEQRLIALTRESNRLGRPGWAGP